MEKSRSYKGNGSKKAMPAPAARARVRAAPRGPRRRGSSRWIRFGLAIGVFFLLSIVGCYLAGTDGPPPQDQDLRPQRSEVPSAENGFRHLLAAGRALDWPEDKAIDARLRTMAKSKDWNGPEVRDLLARNEGALRSLDLALRAPRLQIPEPVGFDGRSFSILPWKRLGDLLSLRVRLLSREGLENEAFEVAFQLIDFGHRLEAAEGGLIDHLMGSSLKQGGFQHILEISPAERVPTTRLLSYVARLEDFNLDATCIRRAYQQDYVDFAELIDDPSKEVGSGFINFISLPLLGRYVYQRNNTRAMLAEAYRMVLYNLGVPYADRKVPQPPDRSDILRFFALPNSVGKIVYGVAIPREAGWTVKSWEANAASAAKLALAVECYRRRRGRLPATLDALVPGILRSVPLDDFDGSPMRYSAKHRWVYSVGPDLIDEGGSESEAELREMPDPTYRLGR